MIMPTTVQIIYGIVSWVLSMLPVYITSILTVIRFLQIQNPFKRVQKKSVLPILVAFVSLNLAMYLAYMFYPNQCGPAVRWHTYIKALWAQMSFLKIHQKAAYLYSSAIIAQIIAVIMSVITAYLLTISTSVSRVRAAANKRSAVKVILMNTNSLVYVCTIVVVINDMSGKGMRENPLFICTCILPILSSTINPIIFVLLTPDSRKRKTLDYCTFVRLNFKKHEKVSFTVGRYLKQ